MPFDSIGLEDNFKTYVKQTIKPLEFDDFVLTSPQDIDLKLATHTTDSIQNIFFFYELDDDEDGRSIRLQVKDYLLYSLGSVGSLTRIISNRKTAEYFIRKVNKAYSSSISVPEDFSLVSIACGKPIYTPLSNPAR